jgi:hypothetical protein
VRRAGGVLPPAVAPSSGGSATPAPIEDLRLVANDGVQFSLAWSAGRDASVFEVYPEGGEPSRVGVPSVTLGWPASARPITVRVAAVSASGSYSRWASVTVDPGSQPAGPSQGPDAAQGGHGSSADSQSGSGGGSETRPGSARTGQTSGRAREPETSGRRDGPGADRPTTLPTTAAPTTARPPESRPTTTEPLAPPAESVPPAESAPTTRPPTSTKPDPSTPAPASPSTPSPTPSPSGGESSGGATGATSSTPSASRTTTESDSEPSPSVVPTAR